MRLIATMALLMTGCGSMADAIHTGQAKLAWADQQPGARSAFVRCASELSAHECGKTDVCTETRSCMQSLVQQYRSEEDKTAWLEARGCSPHRAKLRGNEL